jgi:DNA invertase Pin-like site-specific DNA recombinase
VRDILLAVLASLAKQEAKRMSERVKAGMARARSAGKHLGRRFCCKSPRLGEPGAKRASKRDLHFATRSVGSGGFDA